MLKMFDLPCSVAGTDEAGRGCLAGPVTAAAVILPKNFKSTLLNDSKQTREGDRNKLREIIINEAISYSIEHVYMEEIDKLNILNASILAMHRAIENLDCDPEYIIVDGNKFKPFRNIPHECIIKGDAKFFSIAAASILAKTARDEFMKEIHLEFPAYNWNRNKGYPTKEHRQAIREHGSTPYHRKSFKLLPEQLKLSL
ncbi:ribonuclease HII [Salegentibacter maritimus]|uniref:Ribonuclease HII n=1 Tax=Salegentibacter maritimus TaxID=2794347 RepID=A0ABS0TLW7_9FLAO|nr:ribonuclease HII [Salegentibacter maritimus]MBI6121226.1 ribonuclease HII [Salegentibacter maritimus]